MKGVGDEATDPSLVALAAKGDAAAFDVLVGRWKDRLLRLALRFFRRREDAEEIVQEVFMRLHRAAGRYRADAPFEHWLMRIATNACRDGLRRRRRRPEVVLSDLSDDAAGWLDAALLGEALDAERVEAARGVAADLLASMPERDRIVLVLLDLEGLSAAEVAAATGSTRAAVKVRAMRARRALRRLAETVGGRES
ncbi:MAG TPA: sigma-70 family RNA polymerase sigma factor [Candidatus Polarisedimenticolia bacterium]|nr:sigma-70 family RNA polymerase sigma factor [Candidatus Polarisedimenticolia bacterium]